MRRPSEIRINGQKIVVRSDEGEEYLKSVEAYLNTKIEEVKEKTRAVSTLDLTLLAALNIAGEAIKAKEALELLGRRSEALAELIDRKLREF